MSKRIIKKLLGIKFYKKNGKQEMIKQNMTVFVTHDKKGITLSISSKQDDMMYTVPLDDIADDIIEALQELESENNGIS